jgi:hypothetical protein
VEKYGTVRQATNYNMIRSMRFACWITKATDTYPEYVILLAFHGNARQQWLLERSSILRIYAQQSEEIQASAGKRRE